ncbi:cytochrome c-type biogenesis protein [Caldinitratiruptor microaerophilus]|uniref:Cytochrome c-type biogenesis protein n=1 Tax=Caldinitratiruptor microaerophilus TaxID=671077 RepID=A0AA35G8J4_9FIRM|nr:cytochrome c-type biogenesis protein CcmH [Caldinitratiruptor microaerophilus]BDG61131.1 hypothetical protein caldi_22210 [Caldinitratiruptor microaerophilus]
MSRVRAALLALAASILMVLGGARPAGAVHTADQVRAVARQIRCPLCKNLSAWDSDTLPSREIVADVERRLHAGETPEQILAAYEARYGAWILMYPPRRGVFWLMWLAPFAAVALGGAVLVTLLRRWLRVYPGGADSPGAGGAAEGAPGPGPRARRPSARSRARAAAEWLEFF